jgi:hypothetical protein
MLIIKNNLYQTYGWYWVSIRSHIFIKKKLFLIENNFSQGSNLLHRGSNLLH